MTGGAVEQGGCLYGGTAGTGGAVEQGGCMY